MTKQIKLFSGSLATVDDEDFEIVNKYRWHAVHTVDNGSGYASHSVSLGNNKFLKKQMHHLVLGCPDGPGKGLVVDHINGNTLDNRKQNLRICSQRDNARNSSIHSNNTSGYKGVCLNKKYNLWAATIRIDGKQTHLGFFRTPEEAAVTYDNAAIKHYGEFAKPNGVTGIVPNEVILTGQPSQTKNLTGYRGVRLKTNCKTPKWESFIKTGGKQEYLGLYDSPEKAARAYDAAIFSRLGTKAILNFPDQAPTGEQLAERRKAA